MTWRPNQFADAPFPEGMIEEIARVLKCHDALPAGLDSYEDVFRSPLMFPLQRRREMEGMMRLARSVDPKTAVAIGVDKAGDPYHWLKCLKLERFVGIEIRGTPYGEMLSAAFPETKCLWLGRSSYDDDTLALVRVFLGGNLIDALFIDGDKAQFSRDFESYLPLVRRGGIVFMHDVSDASPGAAFLRAQQHERVRSSFAFTSTVEVAESLAREAQGIPAATAHEGWLRQWRGRSCGVGVLWV